MFREDQPIIAENAKINLLSEISQVGTKSSELSHTLIRILSLVREHSEATKVSIVLVSETSQPSEAIVVRDGQPQHLFAPWIWELDEYGLVAWVIDHQQAAMISNTSEDDRWLFRPKNYSRHVTPESAASFPLIASDDLVGVLTLVQAYPCYWTGQFIDFIQILTTQLSMLIQNARLLAENQRRARVLAAVVGSGSVGISSENVENTLQQILTQTNQALGSTMTSLVLIDPHTDEYYIRALATGELDGGVSSRVPVSTGLAKWVVSQGQGVVIPNLIEDPRYDPNIDRINGLDPPSVLCVPVFSDNQITGVLQAVNPNEKCFASSDLVVLNGIGTLIGNILNFENLLIDLETAKRDFDFLTQNSLDSILITKLDGEIISTNRRMRDVIGWTKDLRNGSIADFLPINRKKFGLYFENLAIGSGATFETIIHTVDEERIPVEVNVVTMVDEKPVRLMWILRDITERKQLEGLRSDLIAMFYHDLRSPLANVVSSLEELAARPDHWNDRSDNSLLNIALRSAVRLQTLTNSMLEVNRLEYGQIFLERKPIDILEVMNEAQEGLKQAVKEKKIQVEFDVPPGLPKIQADRNIILRVMTNLLDNAVKFSPSEGKIWVGIHIDSRFLYFWVRDEGPGILPGDHEKIFDKFTRITQESSEGFGLGLAFCRAAIHAHGGRIWVDTEIKRGSKFLFKLPLFGENGENIA